MAAIKITLFLTFAVIILIFLISHSPQNNLPHHCLDPHSDWEEDDFNNIDVNPTDGIAWFGDDEVSTEQVSGWKLHHLQTNQFNISKGMLVYDKNLDGFLSFTEYGLSTPQNADGDSFDYHMRLLEVEYFNASDTDGDGRLNLTEFQDFLHPSDSNNPKLQQWLSREEIWERDIDRDRKVSYIEFVNGLFVSKGSYDEESYSYSNHYDDSKNANAKLMFSQLDKDGDGYLSAIELLSIVGEVHPSWRYYARKQAEYFVSPAQVGKYGRLNLNEMIENTDILYAAIFCDESY